MVERVWLYLLIAALAVIMLRRAAQVADLERLWALTLASLLYQALVPFLVAWLPVPGRPVEGMGWGPAVVVILLFAAPSLITGPTERLIKHNSEFIPEAPFRFVVVNDELLVPEEQDFDLIVEIEGASVPQLVEFRDEIPRSSGKVLRKYLV